MDNQTMTMDDTHLADLETQDLIAAALDRVTIINESDPRLDVVVEEGVVSIRGNVLTDTIRDAVMYTAARVPGVKKVIDRVMSDTEIEMTMAGKLAAEPVIKASWINLTASSYLGIVTLSGKVDSDAAKEAAGRVAGEMPGVSEVINALVVE
jgi:osmotically-inducible protein OsmY